MFSSERLGRRLDSRRLTEEREKGRKEKGEREGTRKEEREKGRKGESQLRRLRKRLQLLRESSKAQNSNITRTLIDDLHGRQQRRMTSQSNCQLQISWSDGHDSAQEPRKLQNSSIVGNLSHFHWTATAPVTMAASGNICRSYADHMHHVCTMYAQCTFHSLHALRISIRACSTGRPGNTFWNENTITAVMSR